MTGPDGRELPPGTRDPGRVETFEGAGGRPLRFRVVTAARERHRLLYLHGIESHGGWFLPAAGDLSAHGCTTYLLDRRGSGLNRETDPGDVAGAGTLLEDVRRFREHVGGRDVHLVGLSWGGRLATAAAIVHPEGLASLVLVTPGLRARVDLPAWDKVRLLAGLAFGGRNRFRVPIEPEMFTRTPLWLGYVTDDPLRLHDVTGRFLLAGIRLDRLIRRRISELRLPVLLFLAGGDRIIDNEGVLALLERLPGGGPEIVTYQEATHSVQFDQREKMVADLLRFLETRAHA